jgi:hypothetical protein
MGANFLPPLCAQQFAVAEPNKSATSATNTESPVDKSTSTSVHIVQWHTHTHTRTIISRAQISRVARRPACLTNTRQTAAAVALLPDSQVRAAAAAAAAVLPHSQGACFGCKDHKPVNYTHPPRTPCNNMLCTNAHKLTHSLAEAFALFIARQGCHLEKGADGFLPAPSPPVNAERSNRLLFIGSRRGCHVQQGAKRAAPVPISQCVTRLGLTALDSAPLRSCELPGAQREGQVTSVWSQLYGSCTPRLPPNA